jgi:hypothetical protein
MSELRKLAAQWLLGFAIRLYRPMPKDVVDAFVALLAAVQRDIPPVRGRRS